jgi:hypothetical protein
LKKRVKSEKLTKNQINRGYNKYLRLNGETMVTIDDENNFAGQVWDV